MPHIQAKLKTHGSKPGKLEKKSIKELKELLKEDELKRWVIETQQEGLKVSSIKYVKPISNEMKTLFSLADQVERRRLGILNDHHNVDE
jgi:transposase